jgi:UDP-N-acetylglucosamine transferase subunit ALG13
MHAKCQREMVEKKRRGVPNGAANSVKLTETANAVDSLVVQVEYLGRPVIIQTWLRSAAMNKMHTGHDASPMSVASDVQRAAKRARILLSHHGHGTSIQTSRCRKRPHNREQEFRFSP